MPSGPLQANPAGVSCSYLSPTRFIDSDHEVVQQFLRRVAGPVTDPRPVATRLFAAIRDEIRYDPYSLSSRPEDYRASAVLEAGSGYCVPKAVALTAAARAAGIPAGLGFADVRNHLQSERLLAAMGTDLFVYHGYSTLFLDGRWFKASPAFNRELCERFGVPPLEFDGTDDALLHAYTGSGERHMEYVLDHGTTAELPFKEIMAAYAAAYPRMADSHPDQDGTTSRDISTPS